MKTPPKDSTIINICIIPEEEVSEMFVRLSQSLDKNNTLFLLDGKNKFPHMTVYMARFADSEIERVVNNTKEALKGAKKFTCQHNGYFMTKGRYLEASYQKSEEFMDLHKLITDNLKALRINPEDPFEEGYFTPYTKEQQQNAKETGYDLAYNLYRPHITLTRYKEGSLPEKLPEFEPIDLSFSLRKVCVYKADNNGAVYEKLSEFIIK